MAAIDLKVSDDELNRLRISTRLGTYGYLRRGACGQR
jgi:hypothetical protein